MINILNALIKCIPIYRVSILFTCAVFTLTTFCFAQTSVVMPPLPEASVLVKSIDRPVSAYTGSAQINVPLWSIKLKNLQIPITLNYDATGVKVEQESSWVGLSWTLSAGGVITRSVNDIPDDYNKGETISSSQDRPFDTSPSSEHPRMGRFWSGKYEALRDFDFSNTTASYVGNALNNIKTIHPSGFLEGMNDIEPDVFYFSFGGKSGKFVFDITGSTQKIVLTPFQDVVITHSLNSSGEIVSFIILDNDGTEYLFNQVERLNRSSASLLYNRTNIYLEDFESDPEGNTQSRTVTKFNSSWYLSRITTINQETVNFFYSDESFDQYDRPGSSGKIGTYTNGVGYNHITSDNCGRTVSTTKKRLVRIETDKETIDFNAVHQRQDMQAPSFALTSILIKDLFGITIRDFEFDYSYFQSPASEALHGTNESFGSLEGAQYPSYYKRIKLNSITEKAGDLTNPPYKFYYNESSSLPNRFSYQQDIWGYFNGAVANTSLFPKTYIYPALQGSDRFRVYPICNQAVPTGTSVLEGENRLPNADFIKTGTIYKMEYPTGGYSEFVLESNRFSYGGCDYDGGGLRIKEVKNFVSPDAQQPATITSYSYLDEQGVHSSGKIMSMPVFVAKTLVENFYYNNSQVALGTTSGSYVGYERVKETFVGQPSNNGSIVYEYNVPASYNEATDAQYGLYNITQVKWYDDQTYLNNPEYLAYKNAYHLLPNTMPFAPNPEYDWNRGTLKRQVYLNSSGDPIKEVLNTYTIVDAPQWKGLKNVYGLRVSRIGNVALYSKFEILTNRANVLLNTTEKMYDNAGVVFSNPTTFSYANSGHLNPIEVTSANSKGELIVRKAIYPQDYDSSTPLPLELLQMKNKNLSTYPIEELSYIKIGNVRSLVGGKINLFRMQGNIIMRDKIFEVETSVPITDFVESSTYFEVFNMSDAYKEKVSFKEYDSKGNPLEIQNNTTGLITSYIWGYNNQYPIAQIINATYDQIESLLGSTLLTNLNNGYEPVGPPPPHQEKDELTDIEVRNFLNPLRTGLPNARVTTYTYKPQIGITSTTDPNGKVVFYTYDNFNRLNSVKDNDGNILKTLTYQYKQ